MTADKKVHIHIKKIIKAWYKKHGVLRALGIGRRICVEHISDLFKDLILGGRSLV